MGYSIVFFDLGAINRGVKRGMSERKTRNDVLVLWMIFVFAVKGLYVASLSPCFIPSRSVIVSKWPRKA